MRKKLVEGTIPSLFLPTKKHDKPTSEPRLYKERTLLSTSTKPHRYYKSLAEVKDRIINLKLQDQWEFNVTENEIIFKKNVNEFKVAYFQIIIDSGLGYTLIHLEWFLPEDHILYKEYHRSMHNITVSTLIQKIESYQICNGVKTNEIIGELKYHVSPTLLSHEGESESPLIPFNSKITIRQQKCEIFIENEDQCYHCKENELKLNKSKNIKISIENTPAHANAPLSNTSHNRVVLALKQKRLECNELKKELEKMKIELEKNSIEINYTLHKDLTDIISDSKKTTPFIDLFWQQQKKLFQCSPKGGRYHPMIIRFALSLHSKSSSAYEELRNSEILRLPSSRTLRDYKNYIRPKPGFRRDIIEDLKVITDKYFDTQRYIGILIDEMKIKSNLVFDKNSEELIGFLDLGDPDLNFLHMDEAEPPLSKYAMVFFLRGISTNLKYSFAYFATNGATSAQIFPLFWEAVSYLEEECNLWVLFCTSDGASQNRTFYKMHKILDADCERDICYRTKNLFATSRYIYFFADVPHLIKTARNCLSNSGTSKGTRYMWNEGEYLLWHHIEHAYNDELQNGTKVLTKLTNDHIYLNPYSIMVVKYAAQVLSKTVSCVLKEFESPETYGTAVYCEMVDNFFDCLNVRSLSESTRKIKPFLKPYTLQNDQRFLWLENIFLNYFEKWLLSISNRPGNFTQRAKSKMFIAYQTHQGFKITCYSAIECIKFLLAEGMEYVLTERFCQDSLEQYFGNQRKIGRRSDNPDLRQFGYNDNTIRIQRNISITSGNTKGRYDSKRSWENVSDDPVPKRITKRK